MEVARCKHVITIGLSTITYNKDAVGIIIAAGEAKAKIVAATIEGKPSNEYPGSVLANLPNARFYLTKGAASRLVNRRFVDMTNMAEVFKETIHRTVMDISLDSKKPIKDLTLKDFQQDRFGAELLKKTGLTFQEMRDETQQRVISNLAYGNKPVENKTFLHTSPHHDDIILGYLPYVTNLVRRSSTHHSFAYMTSGFTAVTNSYMKSVVGDLLKRLERGQFRNLLASDYFEAGNELGRRMDISYYHEGAARKHEDKKSEAISRRLLRNMIELYEDDSIDNIMERCSELLNYFRTQYRVRRISRWCRNSKAGYGSGNRSLSGHITASCPCTIFGWDFIKEICLPRPRG